MIHLSALFFGAIFIAGTTHPARDYLMLDSTLIPECYD